MSYEDPELVAIDPAGCGCTECLIGEYKPLDQATDEDIKRLFAGELRDNADVHWSITQASYWEGGGFDVFGGSHSFQVGTLDLPLRVALYSIELNKQTFERLLEGGGYPSTIGKDS